MGLTNRQHVFVSEYLRCWNAAEAARRAGYSERTARNIGYQTLQKPEIQDEINRRMAEIKMSADEVLVRLSEQARLDISQFVKPGGAIDWDAIKANGHLVKKVKHNAGQNSEIELHDAQAALKLLGQAHRLFTERTEVDVKLSVVGLETLLDKVYGRDADDDRS